MTDKKTNKLPAEARQRERAALLRKCLRTTRVSVPSHAHLRLNWRGAGKEV